MHLIIRAPYGSNNTVPTSKVSSQCSINKCIVSKPLKITSTQLETQHEAFSCAFSHFVQSIWFCCLGMFKFKSAGLSVIKRDTSQLPDQGAGCIAHDNYQRCIYRWSPDRLWHSPSPPYWLLVDSGVLAPANTQEYIQCLKIMPSHSNILGLLAVHSTWKSSRS